MKKIAAQIVDVEIWVIGVLAAGGVIFESLLPVCVIAALIFWGMRWIAYGRISIRTPADFSIAVLAILVPVTLWITPIPEVTYLQAYRFLSGIAVYYAIANWARSGERTRVILFGLVLIGGLLAVYAIFSVEWPERKLPGMLSIVNLGLAPIVRDTVNPNVLAGSLALVYPLILAAGFASSDSLSALDRIFIWICLFIVSVVLFLTLSRGAMLALGIAILVFVTLRWRFGWIALPLAGIIIAGIIQQYGAIRILEFLVSGTSSDSVGSRLQLWSRAVLIIQYFPLTGVGMGTFSTVIDRLFPLAESGAVSIPHAHNLFLQVGIDLGVPGIIAWLATWFLAILVSWHTYFREWMDGSKGSWLASIGIGLLCSQLVLILHGMTDAVTWGMVRTSPLVWALWGIVMAYSNLQVAKSVNRVKAFAEYKLNIISIE